MEIIIITIIIVVIQGIIREPKGIWKKRKELYISSINLKKLIKKKKKKYLKN